MGASNADYERQFKEIVAKAKAVYGTGAYDDSTLEFLIPGLRESEDEKIRNLLRKIVITANNGDLQILGDNDTKKCLAYLEKQKDKQNLIEKSLDSYMTDPDGYLKDWSNAYDRGFEAAKELFVAQPEKYGLQKQKEQKTTEVKDPFSNANFVRGYESGYADAKREQKPAQTSEEKEYIRTIKSLISDFIRDKQPADVAFYQKIYDWLDGRYVEQKPAEWSEEDEKMRERLITRLTWITYNTRTDGTSPNITFFDEIDWLESLRPSWKPSEDQLEALEYVCRVYPSGGAEKSLYNNLKKLCEQLQELI